MSTVIDILEHNAQVEGDKTLAAQVRLSLILSGASDSINGVDDKALQSGPILLLGLQQHYQQVRSNIAPSLLASGKWNLWDMSSSSKQLINYVSKSH